MFKRTSGRTYDQLRQVRVSHNVFGYAPGSVLFELGNTKVLCAVTLQMGVPLFLKGKKKGWLTAEYAMLPTSTHARSVRESTALKKNERAIEISRLIGRSLRAVVNLDTIGERTIHVDCDVLQADGSTRTACITGAYLALEAAVKYWLANGEITENILTDAVAAVSVGVIQDQVLVDLDFSEDSIIDADYNFVLTKSQHIIEIQGTTEKNSLTWLQFNTLCQNAAQAVEHLFTLSQNSSDSALMSDAKKVKPHAPLFSLQNRLVRTV